MGLPSARIFLDAWLNSCEMTTHSCQNMDGVSWSFLPEYQCSISPGVISHTGSDPK